jgi:hypothetical protein
MRCRFLAGLNVGCEQVVCDRWAHAWLTRTLRIFQYIAAFIRIKSLPIFCSEDRARYIVFAHVGQIIPMRSIAVAICSALAVQTGQSIC